MSVQIMVGFVNNPCQIKYVERVAGYAELFGVVLIGYIFLVPVVVMRICGVRVLFPVAAAPRPMTVEKAGIAIPSLVVTRICGALGVLAVFPALAEHRVEQMTAGQPRRKTAIPSLVRRPIRLLPSPAT